MTEVGLFKQPLRISGWVARRRNVIPGVGQWGCCGARWGRPEEAPLELAPFMHGVVLEKRHDLNVHGPVRTERTGRANLEDLESKAEDWCNQGTVGVKRSFKNKKMGRTCELVVHKKGKYRWSMNKNCLTSSNKEGKWKHRMTFYQ